MTTSERTGSRSDEPDGPSQSPAPVMVPASDDSATPTVGLAALARARADRARDRRPTSPDPVSDPSPATLAPSPADRAPSTPPAAAPALGGPPLADTMAVDVVDGAGADGRATDRSRSSGRQGRRGRRGARATPTTEGRKRSPAPQTKPPTWWWRFGFPIVLLALIVAVPVLIWVGKQAVLESSDGTVVAITTDPSQPGWEAVTPPTPTMLLVQVDDNGSPVALTVFSQTGQSSGGIIFVPLNSVLTIPTYGSEPLTKAFADLGMDGLRQGVQNLLGVGVSDVQVIDTGQMADLLGAIGPLQFTNTESLVAPGYLLFPKGPLTLQPEQAGPYLATSAPNSVDTNRLLRHEAFWTAVLAKLSTNPVTLPGDADKGLAAFLPELAKTQVDIETIPVNTVRLPGSNDTLFNPVPDQLAALIGKLIPFPTEASAGTRPKVRILDGTGTQSHGVAAAPALVGGGAQIAAVGNAANFNFTQTELVYSDDAQKDAADKLAAALGFGQVVKSGQPNTDVDVTVILGTDAVGRLVAGGDTVITSPPANIGTVTVTSAGGTGN